MRMPFQKLMETLYLEYRDITLGELSKELNEPIERIMDAIDANRVLDGEQTYIP